MRAPSSDRLHVTFRNMFCAAAKQRRSGSNGTRDAKGVVAGSMKGATCCEHFYVCEACGQAVDMRKLGDVFHHEEPEHEPLPAQ